MRRVAPFDPTQIAGCKLWLDGSDAGSITLSSGSVTQWNDKSGNNNTMTPYSSYSNVTISSAYQNGLNVLNFSGSGVYKAPTSSAVYPLDVYVVLALKDTTTAVDVIGININTSGTDFNSLTFSEYTSSRWHNGSDFFNRTPNTVSPINETSTSFLLINWSIANANYIIRRNGVQLSQTSSYTFTLAAGSIFQIGHRLSTGYSPTPDHPFKGYIAEIVAFNSQLATSQQQQIEGYLAQKWGLRSNLPGGHSGLTSAIYPSTRIQFLTPMAYTYTPTTIAGCFLWLDAKDPTTFAFSSGSNIMTWIDKSGVGNNATSSNGTATYTANSVYFPGSANLITNANITLNNVTIFTLFTYTGTVGYRCLLTGYSNTSSVGGLTVVYNNLSGSNFYLVGSYGVTNVVTAPLNSASGGSPYIVCFTNTSSVPTLYQNGSNVTNSPVTQVLTGTYKTSIGADVDGLQYVTGNLYEVIVFSNVLTTTQRQNVEGYLAAKWSLQSSLSSDNPYKSNPLSITNIFNVARPAPLANQYPTPITNAYFVSNTPPSYRVINLNSYTYGSVTSGTFTMNSVLGGGSITFTGSDVFASSSQWGPQQAFDNIRTDYDWATSGNPPFGQFVFPRAFTMTKLFIVPRNQQDNFPATFTLIVDTVTIGTYSNTSVSAAQGLSVSFTGTGFYVQPNLRGTTWRIEFPNGYAWIGEIEFYGYV
jgi:hypothetical protein